MADQRLPSVDGDDGIWGTLLNQFLDKEHYNDDVDVNQISSENGGHKKITIQPGTSAAGTAPLKFTSGTLLSSPEAGAVEFNSDKFYVTQTTGSTRKTIAAYDDTSGATGDIYYRDSSGNFIRLAVGGNDEILTVTSGLPSWKVAPAGDITGPASATDNAVVRFDATTGKIIQDSAVTIADTTGDITGGKYNTVAISGTSTPTLAVTGTTTVSGDNTGDQTLPTDQTLAFTDVTNNNASTTAHGFAPKATAPASTFINVLGIGNAETVYSNKALFDATAPSTQAYGDAASAGTATVVARRDHKHAMPAAVTDSTISVTDITTNNASTTAHGFAPKVTAPAATFINVLGVANGETIRSDKALFDATVPSTQAYGDAASAGTSTSAARRDHKHAMPNAQHVLTAIWGDAVQSASVVAGTVTYVRVPYGGTITSWHVVADVAITATMDIWKSNAAVPTVANTITAAAKPSLTTAATATSSTLTGWTTTVAVGDVFGFRLDTLTSGTPTAITLVINIG